MSSGISLKLNRNLTSKGSIALYTQLPFLVNVALEWWPWCDNIAVKLTNTFVTASSKSLYELPWKLISICWLAISGKGSLQRLLTMQPPAIWNLPKSIAFIHRSDLKRRSKLTINSAVDATNDNCLFKSLCFDDRKQEHSTEEKTRTCIALPTHADRWTIIPFISFRSSLSLLHRTETCFTGADFLDPKSALLIRLSHHGHSKLDNNRFHLLSLTTCHSNCLLPTGCVICFFPSSQYWIYESLTSIVHASVTFSFLSFLSLFHTIYSIICHTQRCSSYHALSTVYTTIFVMFDARLIWCYMWSSVQT